MMIFWTSIVAPFIVGIVLIAVNKLFSKNKDDGIPHKSFTMRQINITNVNQTSIYQQKKRNESSQKGSELLMAIVLIGGFIFDKALPYIIIGILSITFLMLGIFLYTVFYSYQHRIIHGEAWAYFLLTTVFITIITGFLALNLIEPIQVIDYDSQTPMLSAVSKILAPSYQSIGVLFIGLGMYLIVMTQIHYLSGLKFLSTGDQDQLSYKIFYKTQRYRKPWRSVALAVVPFILAFFFINNFVYLWIN